MINGNQVNQLLDQFHSSWNQYLELSITITFLWLQQHITMELLNYVLEDALIKE
jgi:hypothetical protein